MLETMLDTTFWQVSISFIIGLGVCALLRHSLLCVYITCMYMQKYVSPFLTVALVHACARTGMDIHMFEIESKSRIDSATCLYWHLFGNQKLYQIYTTIEKFRCGSSPTFFSSSWFIYLLPLMGVLTLPRAKPMLLFPQYDLPCHAKSSAFRHKAFGVQRHPQRRKTSIGCESKNKKERNGKNQEKSGTAAKNCQKMRKNREKPIPCQKYLR